MSKKFTYVIKMLTVVLLFSAVSLCGAIFNGKQLVKEMRTFRADKWTWDANNVILEGNVVMPSAHFHIVADKVIMNIDSRDVECIGNVRLLSRNVTKTTLTNSQLDELRKYPDVVVEIEDVFYNTFGEPFVNALVYYVTDKISADKLSGNLITGYLSMQNVRAKSANFAVKAKSAVRKSNGDIDLHDADFSTCEYLEEDNAHYSLSASEMKLRSYQDNGFDIKNYDFSIGQHSIFAKNAFVNIYGVPVMWLPVFYKPKDESPGLFDFTVGATSDWGFFILMNKEIKISEYPYANADLLLDFYSERGWGYGTEINVSTENSKTNLFAYGIYDKDPYEGFDNIEYKRMRKEHFRYDVRFANVTHITPSFDFRSHVEFLSDPYMQYDYFREQYNNNPEPASYAAFEKYFDNFTVSLFGKVRVNTFSATVQKLPEFRIDVPRMEIFNTNLYYQGAHSLEYLTMEWRNFDEPRRVANRVDPEDYASMRLDSVNFLYYPFKLFNINIIPRAGVRFTVYSDSSSRPISGENLQAMFIANDIDGYFRSNVVNYDNNGGSRVRFIGEFGFEANTKLYRTFNNVRNKFLKIDGLKHVMVPYVNYTFITKPSVDREYLFYFDDIDRIDRQNFFRLGVENRLYTRASNRLLNTFRMENYIDLHLDRRDGFNHIGDFCTKLSTSPIKGLVISTEFAINAGNNFTDRQKTYRATKWVDRKGIKGNWLNRWRFSLRYEPIDDFIFSLSFLYRDNYSTRSTYSMGTTLDEIESGSAFDKYYALRTQILRFGVSLPLTPDRRTRISYQINYDFEAGFIESQRISLMHQFHCWEFALMFAHSYEYDGKEKEDDYSILFNVTLNGMRNPLQQVKHQMSDAYRLYSGKKLGGL